LRLDEMQRCGWNAANEAQSVSQATQRTKLGNWHATAQFVVQRTNRGQLS